MNILEDYTGPNFLHLLSQIVENIVFCFKVIGVDINQDLVVKIAQKCDQFATQDFPSPSRDFFSYMKKVNFQADPFTIKMLDSETQWKNFLETIQISPKLTQGFKHRDKEMEQVGYNLKNNKFVVISGPSGTGKKQLVCKYLKDISKSALWIPYEQLNAMYQSEQCELLQTNFIVIVNCLTSESVYHAQRFMKALESIKGWFIITNEPKSSLLDKIGVVEVKQFDLVDSAIYFANRAGLKRVLKIEEIMNSLKFFCYLLKQNPWALDFAANHYKTHKLTDEKFLNTLNIFNKGIPAKLNVEQIQTILFQDLFRTFAEEEPECALFLTFSSFYTFLVWNDKFVENVWNAISKITGKEVNPLEKMKKLEEGGYISTSLDGKSIFSIPDKILSFLISVTVKNGIPYRDFLMILGNEFDTFYASRIGYNVLWTNFVGKSGYFYLREHGYIYTPNSINPQCITVSRIPFDDKINIQYLSEKSYAVCMEEKYNENMFRYHSIAKGNKEHFYFHYLSEEPKKSEIYSHLEHQMTEKGMQVKKNVAGDGNCQFRAAANQMDLNDDYFHPAIRSRAVQWLRANKETKIGDSELFHFQYEFETWEKFCDNMEQDSVWGDHITLIAIANEFHVLIHCITSEGENVEVKPLDGNIERMIWLFHYVNGKHYLSVDPIDKEKWLANKKLEEEKQKAKEGDNKSTLVEETKRDNVEEKKTDLEGGAQIEQVVVVPEVVQVVDSKNESGQEKKKKKKKKKK